MKKGGGKRKGNSFEIKICKALSLLWSNRAQADLCWRATTSGGKGTITRTSNRAYHGDIAATSPEIEPLLAKFCFELKHYKDIDYTHTIRGCNSKVITFWKQAFRSATLSKRIPVLICKANRVPETIIVDTKHLKAFTFFIATSLPYLTLGNKLAVFDLASVLEHIDVGRLKLWCTLNV